MSPLETKAGEGTPNRRMKRCPFFHTPPTAEDGGLAILHLKRDTLLPVRLDSTADEGYGMECAVTNTRFGSFPHDTLIGLEWGSQVRASKVDTGSRGRKGEKGKVVSAEVGAEVEAEGEVVQKEAAMVQVSKKRGVDEAGLEEDVGLAKTARKHAPVQQLDSVADTKRTADKMGANASQRESKKAKTQPTAHINGEGFAKAAVEAGSGFIHILPPTPEDWTLSLDHRTQVVYTPDYSYILQRLRAKPGDTLIEAGAGSGSFTHAAARAVFSGYPDSTRKKRRTGRVYSYEYHEPRVQTLRKELQDHGLENIVQLTHRDVCNDGFLLSPDISPTTSPHATAIFLDLPAPWLALKYLTHTSPSPLKPGSPVHICTFSPCIEQVTATVSHLRKLGWTEIEMLEIQNRRLDVRREHVGLKNEGLQGVNSSAATVEEAVERLREVEGGMHSFHSQVQSKAVNGGTEGRDSKQHQLPNGEGTGGGGEVAAQTNGGGKRKDKGWEKRGVPGSKAVRLAKIRREAEERQLWKEGNLVHRTEGEIKTHTSYLVFAVLPGEWTEEDERACGVGEPVEVAKEGAREKGKDGKGEVVMSG
ncbi:tRNA (adenine-N(1)-)-methyltransferase catalytic subunit trm61 [Friedmanniomyces endolithicus]|uniref:tRNA (adenine(58)-N(1))-methyltransferase catalytic subunit TRM61 n=1 Tax=Friedmanniomyces endolithicus TaxID=329885 RepID=A0AAN6KBD2_9PEZI|nr:tRNA (adenine-N(1)-)-methyltransferase catalytic subunit trm61 [Friedmanniomyces endolithicus]KAK0798885.1 tRNA (adenine-N(1)-)-methyltransferase catalytic subunit trm61 [Friedmanniomyces endolithicus]KAK0805776.1 tRNA (adenine-N(1)-)-methyltransferase catalytic subunit trm61 [Friedmanniomyces endolithicus]KAK0849974.1 tRNA (adenine-N(1)-)-methyltransferase catalytic subunit trm61 [Friedmanniomyces endolithicus]KAK0863494.1 tRNA (adenine-N(1)-)-methyltransferase catalytic subunit trm61 [Frie